MLVKVVLASDQIALPSYESAGAAGADIRAYLLDAVIIPSGQMKVIPTGIFVEIQEGYEIQVRPRSGLAFKNQVTVLNAPGTIDSDYRGEIMVMLINHSDVPFRVATGDRIAQIVISPVIQVEFLEIHKLSETDRGSKGFGSTGVT
jgi:dUTP pyrophosphatase